MDEMRRASYRLPRDAVIFLEDAARENLTSINAEVLRSVRERMARETMPVTGKSFQAHPATGPNETALAGGPITHG